MKTMKKETFCPAPGMEFDGYRYDEQFVIMINYDGEYFIGEEFNGVISVGSGIVHNYKTLEDAENAIIEKKSRRFVDARLRAKLTQSQMANRLGIPKRTIENWEQGKRLPAPWAARLVLEKLEAIKDEKRQMRKWYMIEDMMTSRALMEETDLDVDTQEEALAKAKALFNKLSKHDQEERDNVYVANFEVDEDGILNYDTLTGFIELK